MLSTRQCLNNNHISEFHSLPTEAQEEPDEPSPYPAKAIRSQEWNS